MPPTLHLTRHAQGVHNVSHENHIIQDPLLTPHGEQQCTNLLVSFPFHEDVELVVASPMRRALYTALLAYAKPIRDKGLKVVALPEIQETSDVPCDRGSDLAALEAEVKENNLPVDLSLLTEKWNIKSEGKFVPTRSAIGARAREARQWLKSRPEKSIAVVSHGGFLHYFTEDWQDSLLYQGTGWANTEFRTYNFRDSIDEDDLYGINHQGDNASIAEATDSRKRRGRTGDAPSREMQKQYFVQAMAGWEQQFAQPQVTEKNEAVEVVPAGDKLVAEEKEEVRVAS